MINIQVSKPVNLLKILTEEEFKQLGKFIKSGLVSNSRTMATLYTTLKNFYPDFHNPRLTSSHLAKKLFPEDKVLKEQKLRKRLSEFSKLTLQFIAYQELQTTPSLQEELHRQFFIRKNSFKEFKKSASDTLSLLDKNPVKDTALYQAKNNLYENLYQHSLDTNFLPSDNYLNLATKNLDNYYFLKKLEYTFATLSIRQIKSKEAAIPLSKADIKLIKEKYQSDPVFSLYLQLIKLKQDSTNNKLFNPILQTFKKEFTKLSPRQNKTIIYQLLNYSFEQVKLKHSRFLQSQFDLYQFGLQHGLFLKNEILSEKTFLNIAVTAALNNRFDVVDNLIVTYSSNLPKAERQKAIDLSKAFMYFHKGNYEKAYDLVFNFDESDLHYKLRTRLLKLRCLYHMQLENNSYLKTLKSQIKSYEVFINREKNLNPANQSSYLNFSNILKEIINKPESKSLNKLKKEWQKTINGFDTIIAKNWLLDIIKSMQ